MTNRADRHTQFGRFRLLRRLGAGAMGEVFLAHDPALERQVAIKMPQFTQSSQLSEERFERFVREARAAAAIDHPHINAVYDVGILEGTPYIVMPFVHGETLSTRRCGRELDIEGSVRMVLVIARAMSEAHGLGIIHRDLKPENIIVNPRGEPVVMDFGLAKFGPNPRLTKSGYMVGSPAYMSPEQAAGDSQSADHRCDIFSLGVILYELMTGQLPFEDSGLAGIVAGILHVNPAAPSQANPAVPELLDTICLKAMAKRPSHRFQTMTAFADALEAALENRRNGQVVRLRRRVCSVAANAAALIAGAGQPVVNSVVRGLKRVPESGVLLVVPAYWACYLMLAGPAPAHVFGIPTTSGFLGAAGYTLLLCGLLWRETAGDRVRAIAYWSLAFFSAPLVPWLQSAVGSIVTLGFYSAMGIAPLRVFARDSRFHRHWQLAMSVCYFLAVPPWVASAALPTSDLLFGCFLAASLSGCIWGEGTGRVRWVAAVGFWTALAIAAIRIGCIVAG